MFPGWSAAHGAGVLLNMPAWHVQVGPAVKTAREDAASGEGRPSQCWHSHAALGTADHWPAADQPCRVHGEMLFPVFCHLACMKACAPHASRPSLPLRLQAGLTQGLQVVIAMLWCMLLWLLFRPQRGTAKPLPMQRAS